MSVVDLHPEELFDKEMMGELSVEERVRLDAHMAACVVCRFERASRDDFREAFIAEGQRAKLAGMIALATADKSGPRGVEEERSAEGEADVAQFIPRTKVSARVRFAVLFAAAFLVASVAMGASSSGARVFRRVAQFLGFVEASPALDERAEALRSAPEPFRQPSVLTSASALPDVLPPPPSSPADELPPPPVSSHPSAVVPQPVWVSPRPVAAAASQQYAVPVPSASALMPAIPEFPKPSVEAAPVASALPPMAPPSKTPGGLFAEANEARKRSDYGRAIALYTELERSFPASREASATLVILGRLLLDRGDALGALQRFDTLLRVGGGLREEAMVGRALSLARLGRAGEEAATWTSLLREFPGSAHAARARARLESLGSP